MTSLLTVNQLYKSYGQTKVLNGLNFEIKSKVHTAIRGASGSGKSTLLYLIGGLDVMDSGEIIVDNLKIKNLSDAELGLYRNQKVGFVFQFHYLLPSMNCLNNILLPGRINGADIKKIETEILELASVLGVSHCLEKYPFELSGGEQQRINILRAVSLHPKLILCDEPTGNLDSKNTEIVITLLKTLAEKYNSTLIVVTHDLKVSAQFSGQIYLEDGQIKTI